jgi:hypothetical protein
MWISLTCCEAALKIGTEISLAVSHCHSHLALSRPSRGLAVFAVREWYVDINRPIINWGHPFDKGSRSDEYALIFRLSARIRWDPHFRLLS